ncbi:MAG: SprT-like domain-containing protein [Proteobacteria bacterium]|nr:SprT-like domain-containing protein [Pseudomonadota bacterium]
MGITKEEYSNLDYAFDYFNRHLFSNDLPDVMFTYQYKGRAYGRYISRQFARRFKTAGKGKGDMVRIAEIALNPKVFTICPDIEIFQTIVHEMAHHWQYCYGKPSRYNYHNNEWRRVMEEMGLIPSNTGKPGGKKTGQAMADYPEPGGPFETLAKQLIASGYTVKYEIPWTARDMAKIQQAAANLDSHFPTTHVVAEPKVIEKTKYQCKCKNKVWGKPGLKLRCEECKTRFVRKEKPESEMSDSDSKV